MTFPCPSPTPPSEPGHTWRLHQTETWSSFLALGSLPVCVYGVRCGIGSSASGNRDYSCSQEHGKAAQSLLVCASSTRWAVKRMKWGRSGIMILRPHKISRQESLHKRHVTGSFSTLTTAFSIRFFMCAVQNRIQW